MENIGKMGNVTLVTAEKLTEVKYGSFQLSVTKPFRADWRNCQSLEALNADIDRFFSIQFCITAQNLLIGPIGIFQSFLTNLLVLFRPNLVLQFLPIRI